MSASCHLRSAVNAGTPRRSASARHARSASESPCGLVNGRSRATATQSAAVIGSIVKARRDPSARRNSAAAASGSLPASASLDRTSAQLTTLTAAPSPIASMTTDAPSSAWSTAISAEASRTDAGSPSATAAPATRGLATLGLCFGPAVGDQLIDQAAIWRHIGEKPPHPLGCGAATFYLGFREPGGMGHALIVSPPPASLSILILNFPPPRSVLSGPILIRDLPALGSIGVKVGARPFFRALGEEPVIAL